MTDTAAPTETPFYSLPNLSASTITPTLAPWELEQSIPEEALSSKVAFRDWSNKPSTAHAFLSLVAGHDPGLRVSKSNPAFTAGGFIVDYDAEMTEADMTRLKEKPLTEFPPNFACQTFSGNGRIIFLFEQQMPFANRDHYKAFATIAAKQLKLRKLAPGFEPESFESPAHYYEVGRSWQALSNDRIPSSILNAWLYEAGNKILKWGDGELTEIPANVVAEELEKRYPGRWSGPFEVGCRGVRFWDTSANNATAAVVREAGMQCFTGEQAFVSWSEIFGPRFVSKFKEKSYGEMAESCAFDGKGYWCKDLTGLRWRMKPNEGSFKRHLRAVFGLSTVKPKALSQVDQALHYIEEHR
jgi:hypothetical protein